MSIVTLTFGVSPEKIKAACEDTNLSDEVVAKLSQLSQVVVDLHINEEGQVTGGFVPDLRKKEVETKPKPVITFESVISAYRKTRDEEIPALNDKVSLLKEVQQKREDWLAAQLTKQGVDNVKIKGVGMALFSKTEVEEQKLGTAFQFEDRIGVGLRFNGGHEVGIRATHYSNAGLSSTNDGVESYALHYTMPL